MRALQLLLLMWWICLIHTPLTLANTAPITPAPQSSVQVTESDVEMIDVYQALSIYQDVDANKNIEYIIQHAELFTPNNTSEEYNVDDVYWTKLIIDHSSLQPQLSLLFSPNCWDQSWEHIDVWIYGEQGLIDTFQIGIASNRHRESVHSNMNLIAIPNLESGSITIIARLEGINENRKPSRISFALLNSDYYPGYFDGYPFTGVFPRRHSHSPFRAHAIVNHQLLIDPDKEWSIEEIHKQWNSLNTKGLFEVEHKTNTVYWLKTRLIGTPAFNGRQIFLVGNSPYWANSQYSPASDNFSFDTIDAYHADNNGDYIHQATGDHTSMKERPLQLWPNFLTIDISVGDTIDYYIRLEGADRRFLMSDIVLYHIDPTSIYPSQVHYAWEQGLFYGALGIHFLFFAMLYLVERDKLYLYFAISIVGLIMIMLFPEDIYSRYVVLPSWRDWHVPLYFMGTAVLSLGILKFTEQFFLIKPPSFISNRLIPIFLVVHWTAAIAMSIYFEYNITAGNPINEPQGLAFLGLQITSLLLPLIIAISAKKSKRVSKTSYLISIAPAIMIGILHLSMILLPNFFNTMGFEDTGDVHQSFMLIRIGVVTMLTLFALSVGFRTNKIRADKEQADILVEQSKIIETKSKQNEILVKEIHHRVKNNLQILSSLLSLQVDHLTDDGAIDALQEGRNRVESMGMIHQKLYRTDNVTSVDMREYTADLCSYLEDAFSSSTKSIKILREVNYDYMDVDFAIPLGLIINELVTNSIKYAFPASNKGEILISLQEVDSQLILSVADNGNPATDIDDSAINASFGTKLIKTLCKKLKGTISIDTSLGYVTTIVFDRYRF